MMTKLRLVALGVALACHASVPSPLDEAPPAPPARLVPLIGEYGSESSHFIVFERDGKLVLRSAGEDHALNEVRADSFVAVVGNANVPVVFMRDGAHTSAMRYGGAAFPSVPLGPESGNQLIVQPVRPLDELRREAMSMQPPAEAGPFRPSDLVELVKLDPTIHLEIRYATSNNLFGTPFYTQARAFMQRPAAEALVRANAALKQHGYGLLIHDGYRPWYVTKMFWEAAPVPKRIFVANPATGSRHNRGEAVDLSLYELATGKPVEMVSTYDETTDRAAADYPGGTSRQRWHRALLRRVMEAEHFTVNPTEWWHFDYADWKEYAIGNEAFEQIKKH